MLIAIPFWSLTALIFYKSIKNYNRLSWWHLGVAGWIALAVAAS